MFEHIVCYDIICSLQWKRDAELPQFVVQQINKNRRSLLALHYGIVHFPFYGYHVNKELWSPIGEYFMCFIVQGSIHPGMPSCDQFYSFLASNLKVKQHLQSSISTLGVITFARYSILRGVLQFQVTIVKI